jgi:hypothetical protein
MFQEIKLAYQRVVRGWDETALWGLDSHFEDVVIPPLKKFLEEQFDTAHQHRGLHNEHRYQIYAKTLDLLLDYELAQDYMQDDWDFKKEDEALKALALYFAENIGWYWD